MSRRVYQQTSFSTGIISRRVEARADLNVYRQGARNINNAIPLKSGAVARRMGFEHLADCVNQDETPRLVPFTFADDQAFVCEFYNDNGTKIRFYRMGELVTDGDGNVVIIDASTPGYTATQLQELKFTQTADILYILHRKKPVHRLKRVENDGSVWEWEEFVYADGPYDPLNSDATILLNASVPSESDTGYPGGTPGVEVGQTIKISNTTGDPVFQGQEGRLVALLIADEYDELNTPAVDSTLRRGVGRILSQNNGTVAFCEVTKAFPTGGLNQSTQDWVLGGFTLETTGFPGSATFFQQRLVLAGTEKAPNRIWLSKTDVFNDFGPSNANDVSTVPDDVAIDATIADDRVNSIRGLVSDARGLLVFCEDGEFLLTGPSATSAVTPTNVAVLRQGSYGISKLSDPLIIGDRVLFCENDGRRVREIGFNFGSDRYQARDLSVLCDEIGNGINGAQLTQTCFTRGSSNIAWFLRTDGVLYSLTYEREENVYAFAKHNFEWTGSRNASGRFLGVTSIPEENREALYAVCKEIDGTLSVQRMAPEFTYNNGNQAIRFLDTHTYYDSGSSSTDTITGLTKYANKTMQAIADRKTFEITFDELGNATAPVAARYYTIGNIPKCAIQTLPLVFGANRAGSENPYLSKTRVVSMKVQVFRTSGLKIEKSGYSVPINYRKYSDEMDDAVGLATSEVYDVDVQDSHTELNTFAFRQDSALPFTLMSYSCLCEVGVNV